VAVVVREDVVEVVIALAMRHEREDRVVSRGIFIRVGAAAPHVRERIDEEREVMTQYESQNTREQERAPHIAHEPARTERDSEVRYRREDRVMAVLESQQPIALEVRNVGEVL